MDRARRRINNIPIIIYMTLAALVFGQSFRNMALAMIAFGWLVMARNVRNLVLMYRDREYNLASRCLGTPVWRILLKNIVNLGKDAIQAAHIAPDTADDYADDALSCISDNNLICYFNGLILIMSNENTGNSHRGLQKP